MSTTLISTIHAELGWTWRDTAGRTTIVNSNRLRALADLNDGTGTDQADMVWHVEDQILAAGNSSTLDLENLSQSIFGDAISLSMAKVKAILIVNTSSSGYLLVGGAAGDEWLEPFAAAGDKVKVMPGGQLLLANPGGGWSVGAGSTDLKIEAVMAQATYDIAILGTSS
ncbi:MAG: hypothetical protein JXM70_13780 [Pirellulales bacterium]|nr:hypothetical protein [Pirellulales bacterium]